MVHGRIQRAQAIAQAAAHDSGACAPRPPSKHPAVPRLTGSRRDVCGPVTADLHESDLEHAFDVLVQGRYLLDYGNMASFYQLGDPAVNGDRDAPMPTPTPPAAKRRKLAVAAEPTEPEFSAHVVRLALLRPRACEAFRRLTCGRPRARHASRHRPRTRTGASILSASSCCCARRCAADPPTAASGAL